MKMLKIIYKMLKINYNQYIENNVKWRAYESERNVTKQPDCTSSREAMVTNGISKSRGR
ncbi:hypothetical protein EMIT040CA3_10537 [Bacillus pseudomycoides]